jgi:hypothetical protein
MLKKFRGQAPPMRYLFPRMFNKFPDRPKPLLRYGFSDGSA